MIFIDSGAFLARYLRRDQYHAQSLKAWRRLEKSAWLCFTSNLVLNETFTLLGRRAGNAFAAARARAIYDSTKLMILRPSEQEERDALEIFEKFGDQGISFADSVSFVLMRNNRLKRVFSFDRHFALGGFECFE